MREALGIVASLHHDVSYSEPALNHVPVSNPMRATCTVNLVAGKSSVGAIPTGLRKRLQSVANTGAAGGGAATGRRGSSASGGSDGVSILGGGGAPEPNWQKAVKLTVVNTFFPPIHGGKQLEVGCNRVRVSMTR